MAFRVPCIVRVYVGYRYVCVFMLWSVDVRLFGVWMYKRVHFCADSECVEVLEIENS